MVRSQLADFLQTQTQRRNSAATAQKDLAIILTCYQPPKRFAVGRASLFSPLKLIRSTQLEYFKRSGKKGFYTQYSFAFNQRRVPSKWIALATVQYAARHRTEQIPLAELTYKPNSPGQIFKLSEDAIANHLERAEGIELILNANHRLEVKISDPSRHIIEEIPIV